MKAIKKEKASKMHLFENLTHLTHTNSTLETIIDLAVKDMDAYGHSFINQCVSPRRPFQL